MADFTVIDGVPYRLVKVDAKLGRPRNNHSPRLLETILFQRQTMSIKELAEYYGKSISTINRLLREAREYDAKEEKTKS